MATDLLDAGFAALLVQAGIPTELHDAGVAPRQLAAYELYESELYRALAGHAAGRPLRPRDHLIAAAVADCRARGWPPTLIRFLFGV